MMQTNVGNVGAASPGTDVTTHASVTSTKGTPVQLIASTSFDTFFMIVIAANYANNATSSAGCLDILVGSATEEVLIPNLLMGGCGDWTAQNVGPAKIWEFPVYIPSGTRIAAQAAGERLSTAVNVGVYLYGGAQAPPWKVGSKVTTYGIGTVPSGTAITAGASGAEGSWTQITASTSEDHFCVVPSFQVATGDTSWLARHISVDVGIGSATEEEVSLPYNFATDNVEAMGGPFPAFPIMKCIPSGTRLAMRASGSGTVDGYQGALHCVS